MCREPLPSPAMMTLLIPACSSHVTVPSVDLEDEFEESVEVSHDAILEPKETYGLRPLPYRIGTAAFLAEEDVGLGDYSSESEDEGAEAGGLYDSDQETVHCCDAIVMT